MFDDNLLNDAILLNNFHTLYLFRYVMSMNINIITET